MRSMSRAALLAAVAFVTGVGALSAQCLDGWQYRSPITVDNTSGADALTDFQVKLTVNTAALVSAGKMNADGSDIRFYQSDCCVQLDYWIESGMNTASSIIWVEVASIGAGASETIYMAYGNSDAAAASDGAATFLLFDDFDGSAIDGSTWSTSGGGSLSVSGGAAYFSTGGGATSKIIRSNASFTPPVRSEMKVNASSGSWPNIAQLKTGSGNGYTLFQGGSYMYIGRTFAAGPNYAAYLENGTSIGTNTGVWSLAWSSTGSQTGTWAGGTLNLSSSAHTIGNVNVALGGLESGYGSLTTDWVRVRAYAASEPSTSVGTEEVFAPVITDQPDDATMCTGESVSFTVVATGESLEYQWRKDGVDLANGGNVSGATSATLTLSSLTTADNGSYDVVVSGGCGTDLASDAATLVVHAPPTISVALSPTTLWPANHQMNAITADVDVTGDCTPLTVRLESVTSDEPDNAIGNGDGNTIDDVQGVGTGAAAIDDYWFDVRAERSAQGTGRTYTVVYSVTDAAGNMASATSTIFVPRDMGGAKPSLAISGATSRLALEQNSPNPFASSTEIRYWIGEPTTVSLKVYALDGREVATLVDGAIGAGDNSARWDGRYANGSIAADGIYLYRLEAFGQVHQQRMVLSH